MSNVETIVIHIVNFHVIHTLETLFKIFWMYILASNHPAETLRMLSPTELLSETWILEPSLEDLDQGHICSWQIYSKKPGSVTKGDLTVPFLYKIFRFMISRWGNTGIQMVTIVSSWKVLYNASNLKCISLLLSTLNSSANPEDFNSRLCGDHAKFCSYLKLPIWLIIRIVNFWVIPSIIILTFRSSGS